MGYFMNDLNEINQDIIDKINNLKIGKNKKDFLKKALIEEYNHRDKNFYNLIDKKNPRYDELVDEYYNR